MSADDVLPTILGIVAGGRRGRFVLLPFARGVRSRRGRPRTSRSAPTVSALYRQVLELEFDHQLGKLSTEDYRAPVARAAWPKPGRRCAKNAAAWASWTRRSKREIAAARAAFAAARRSQRSTSSDRRQPLDEVAVALLARLLRPVLAAGDGVRRAERRHRQRASSSTKPPAAPRPPGTNVLLVSFGRKEQAPARPAHATQADAEGRYSFSGLDRDPNLVYLALARYQNVNYPSRSAVPAARTRRRTRPTSPSTTPPLPTTPSSSSG